MSADTAAGAGADSGSATLHVFRPTAYWDRRRSVFFRARIRRALSKPDAAAAPADSAL